MNEPFPAGPPYSFAPVSCQHLEQSRRMIGMTAQAAQPRQALVLGAGRSSEIPLAQLAGHFQRLVVNDVLPEELSAGVADARLDAQISARVELDTSDLTGVTEPLLAACDEGLRQAPDPQMAARLFAAVVDQWPDGRMQLPGPFELIVASCLLSQLHFGLAQGAYERFERRYPGQGEVLRANRDWTAAVYRRARRMEARLIHDIAARLAPGGFLYLSESVQMCHVELRPDGHWQSDGRYRMLPVQMLAEYLDRRFTIVEQTTWNWVVTPPETPGERGRLFDVQGVIARLV